MTTTPTPPAAFPTSETPHLFTEKPDPTVVECARLHEAAETERVLIKERQETERQESRHRHETKRERLENWKDRGFQVMFGIAFCFGTLITAIAASTIAGDYAPVKPATLAPTEPCVESVTQVNMAIGSPVKCPVGATMSLEQINPSTATMKCTCPKEPRDKEKPFNSESSYQ